MPRTNRRCVAILSGALILCIASWPAAAAPIEMIDGIRVVRLSGTPYELGRQHGELLREEIRRMTARVLGYFRAAPKVPIIRGWLVNWWLDRAWRLATPYLSPDIQEELRGLSDGSGVPLAELARIHAVPDRTYSCANLAAWGRATDGGRLIHIRNLDWSIRAGLQEFATVFVVRPAGKTAFINVGWAGFIGVLSGVNEAQISIGEVGAKTVDAGFDGEPMAFLMRRVMEEADSVETAAAVIAGARRTVGVNYILADAKVPLGLALETTRTHVRRFVADDPAEHAVTYARPIADAVFRADTAVDPVIRNCQLASGGNPRRAGLEPPVGSSAYEVRYLGQAAGILAHYGVLNLDRAIQIAGAVSPDSNVQSVILAWPDLLVANAEGTLPAARTRYHRLHAASLFLLE